MDKAEFSGNEQNLSGDDIPAALRDTPVAAPERRVPRVVVFGGVAIAAVIATSGYLLAFAPIKLALDNQSSNPTNSQSAANSQGNGDTVLGHLSYPEAPSSELEPITADGQIKLRKGAAQQWQAMAAAARRDGVNLVAISGFRSVQQQEHLFFDVKAQRGQVASERAAVSAPPGYSEHHTGYAVDVGDGAVPATNLSPDFEKTKAFEWLQANAPRYSFEMSFPWNNSQGVSYEPWHWRYVGDRTSLETFYKVRNLKPTPTPQATP